jgi:hypothetical protein
VTASIKTAGAAGEPQRYAQTPVTRTARVERIHWPRDCSVAAETARLRSAAVRKDYLHMAEMLEREPQTTPKAQHREGPVARTIEQQTAKLPSDTFLWAALGSIGVSLVLAITGDTKRANFVGAWAPTFLCLGIYNKIVKLQGSDPV